MKFFPKANKKDFSACGLDTGVSRGLEGHIDVETGVTHDTGRATLNCPQRKALTSR